MQYFEIDEKMKIEISSYKDQFYKLLESQLDMTHDDNITPSDFDTLFMDGREAYKQGEVSAEHVCWVCGVGLGEWMIKKFDCDWCMVEFENGERVLAVGSSNNKKHYVFPVSSFDKRIDDDEICTFSEWLIDSIIAKNSLTKR